MFQRHRTPYVTTRLLFGRSHREAASRSMVCQGFVWCLLVTSLLSFSVFSQTRTFTADDLEYVLEFPANAWHSVRRPDVHHHLEFIYGNDPANGYLRLRKRIVNAGTTAAELFAQDEKWQLSLLSGYVACSEGKGSNLEGKLKGTMFSYEYTDGGVLMEGRIYYLQVDKQTFYSLQFTGASKKLGLLHAETDSIAQSFRLKE